MIVRVWADESYTSDNGNHTVAIGGWLSSFSQSENFCYSWASVLLKYNIPYFHFQEFADRKHKIFTTTVYDHLDDQQRELFLYELALVACELGIPVGGCDSMKATKENESKTIYKSFAALFEETKLAHYSAKLQADDIVEFIFDENDDPKWRNPLEAALRDYKNKGYPFKDRSYRDDKVFLPLQAADLRIYAVRQNAERFFKRARKVGQARMLDLILDKNHYNYLNSDFPERKWEYLMWKIIDHSRQWKAIHPNEQYYPHIHCPFIQDHGENRLCNET
jgi:hypothetical protein